MLAASKKLAGAALKVMETELLELRVQPVETALNNLLSTAWGRFVSRRSFMRVLGFRVLLILTWAPKHPHQQFSSYANCARHLGHDIVCMLWCKDSQHTKVWNLRLNLLCAGPRHIMVAPVSITASMPDWTLRALDLRNKQSFKVSNALPSALQEQCE